MSKQCRIYLVAGLGLGDEGKGTIVDWLTRQVPNSTVVRYNGGPQAGHHVVEPNGRWHCFAQFGSGTLVPGVKNLLSHKMFVSPENLIREDLALREKGIQDALKRTKIDRRCVVVTILHQMIGQLLETARGNNRHGSCGLGVGQAVFDWERKGSEALIIGDIVDHSKLKDRLACLFAEKFKQAEQIVNQNSSPKVEELWQAYLKEVNIEAELRFYTNFAAGYSSCLVDGEEYLANLLRSKQPLIFEGAQGALLDRQYGFAPYVTKTRTSFGDAEELLTEKISKSPPITKLGIIRAYAHRHGAGPLVSEDEFLTRHLPEIYGGYNLWQGNFRVGWLDLPAIRYGLKICGGVDALALTNLDRLTGLEKVRACTSYEYFGPHRDQLDKFFGWECFAGNRIKITELRLLTDDSGQYGKLLFDCRPLDFVDFSGWGDITGIKEAKNLPNEVKEYVEFLESKEGLNVPIAMISVGPTAADKIIINPRYFKEGFCLSSPFATFPNLC